MRAKGSARDALLAVLRTDKAMTVATVARQTGYSIAHTSMVLHQLVKEERAQIGYVKIDDRQSAVFWKKQ